MIGTIGGWDTIKKETVGMFNRQLRHNIKSLDLQIGELSKELEGLKKDTNYDSKIRTLSDLTDLRNKLAKDEKIKISEDVFAEMDRQIEELTMLVGNLESDEVYTAKVHKLEDLIKARCQLSEAKVNESNAPAIIGLVGGFSAIALVLYYEKTDIITSKAISIATKMFGGR
jgi:polyribonucleotide nucleotidyltransferase